MAQSGSSGPRNQKLTKITDCENRVTFNGYITLQGFRLFAISVGLGAGSQRGLNVAGRFKNNALFSGCIHNTWLCELDAVTA